MELNFLAQAATLGGVATSLATELLKSKYIPVPATKHPRLTAGVLSVLASLYAVYQYNSTNAAALTWQVWLTLIALTALVAALTYNHIIKGS